MLKVNLGIRLTPLENYLNIDFAAQPNQQNPVPGNPYDLDNLIDANEADELLCSDSLDYLPAQGRNKALQHWLNRVSHGGIIVVQGNDMYELARLIHLGQVNLQQANDTVYGIGRKSFSVPDEVIQSIMSTSQFSLESVRYNNHIYTIVCRRK